MWEILPQVSRTFALTIPHLPEPVGFTVATAYLWCRVADTVEDAPNVDACVKHELHDQLIAAIDDPAASAEFSRRASAVLTEQTPEAERKLVDNSVRLTRLTSSFAPVDRAALAQCLRRMCNGMKVFEGRDLTGLRDLQEMNRYCYFVAGVVGEMLTELFCNHDPAIARRRSELLARSVSFGQGLQMTNILKDLWDDLAENRCWLPRSEFEAVGYEFERLDPSHQRLLANQVIERLIAVGHGHLSNALDYTLCIPRHQVGIRRFCFWAIGLALLTLQRIQQNPNYSSCQAVKVPRSSVRLVFGSTYMLSRSNAGLTCLFQIWSRGLPIDRERLNDATSGIYPAEQLR